MLSIGYPSLVNHPNNYNTPLNQKTKLVTQFDTDQLNLAFCLDAQKLNTIV